MRKTIDIDEIMNLDKDFSELKLLLIGKNIGNSSSLFYFSSGTLPQTQNSYWLKYFIFVFPLTKNPSRRHKSNFHYFVSYLF